MSELLVTVLRLGYLVLLWLLVLSAVGVLRRDIFGTRVLARDSLHPRAAGRTARAPGRRRPRGQPSTLRVTAGPLNGTQLTLSESAVLIGRSPGCTLVLDDDYSSNRHARIFPSEGRWYVEDLGSTNGTYLGSQRVTGPVPVGIGQPIRIGQTVIELHK